MKINYKHAKKLCTDKEFTLLEQTKPKDIVKFSEAELKRMLQQSRKLETKWRDQARSQGGASRSEEKEVLFSEVTERIEARLTREEKASKKSAAKKPRGFPKATKKPASKRPLSLKKQAKQKSILTSQRIDASGLNSRVRGHVSARGKRSQAARQSRNG